MKMLGSIREVLKNIKRRKPSAIYCPRCASPKIHLLNGLYYGFVPHKYVCENCGYVGPIVMELEKEEDKS
jgi:transposase-like protein